MSLVAEQHVPPTSAEHEGGAEASRSTTSYDNVEHGRQSCKPLATYNSLVLVSDFDFALPDELIAQDPPARRGDSRLLVLSRRGDEPVHDRFTNLITHLRPGDVLVLNDTRVFPARLIGHRVPSGGRVECLLVRQVSSEAEGHVEEWEALVHPGQKLKPGSHIRFEGGGIQLDGEILAHHYFGRRTVRLASEGTGVSAAIDHLGHIPLPPYIKRDDVPSDRDRYQTVYARERGSIAAPTAGLHFTRDLLDALVAHGVELTEVTLHVGYGTFKPVRADRVEDHAVDAERFTVSESAADVLSRARREGRRIIAVGTTTARALESLDVSGDGRVVAATGETRLFIHPGHVFRLVSGLVTNFHLPRSSLLMLVAALAGRDRVLEAYRDAVERRYRFYSYGDAMLIV
jgi:S-adenosylmethionine:tRNA ribosyltransferase-isomerase